MALVTMSDLGQTPASTATATSNTQAAFLPSLATGAAEASILVPALLVSGALAIGAIWLYRSAQTVKSLRSA